MSLNVFEEYDPTACIECGRDSCEDHFPGSLAAPALAFRSAQEIMSTPAPNAIVRDFAWSGRITTLVSESGGGKTFVLTGLAAAVADGSPWHGRQTQHGSVAYISYEGDAFSLRLRAVQQAQRSRLDHFYVVQAREPISPMFGRTGEVRSVGESTLAEALTNLAVRLQREGAPPIVLIIIDTARASMTGSEDSSEPVAGYLRAVRRLLAQAPGAAGIVAHHAGWHGGTAAYRERGSSAWRGNTDATFLLKAQPYDARTSTAALELRALKTRDIEPPPPLRLIRRRVVLNGSSEENAQTSCIIEAGERSSPQELGGVDTEHDRLDAEVLAVMSTGTITGQRTLREAVQRKSEAVSKSVQRVIAAGWATKHMKGPYVLTAEGKQRLAASPRFQHVS